MNVQDPSTVAKQSIAVGQKRCSSVNHEEAIVKYPKLSEEVCAISNTRRVSSELKTFMEKNNFLKPHKGRSFNICGSCIAVCKQSMDAYNASPSQSTSKVNLPITAPLAGIIEEVIKQIKAKSFKKHDLEALAKALGEEDRCNFKQISSSRPSGPKKDSLLTATYASVWAEFDCSIFKSYAVGLVQPGTSSIEKNKRTERLLAAAANTICMAVNERFISPLSVAQSIVLHSYTGSKSACQMFGAVQPAGSYTYVGNVVDTLSSDVPLFPTGDIYVAFDNQQIVGREYKVSVDGKQPTSTVTSLAVYREANDLRMQYQNIPTDLHITSQNRSTLWNKYVELEASSKSIHAKYRTTWLDTRLQIVKEEFTRDAGDLENNETIRFILSEEYERGLQYDRVPSIISECEVFDMENLMLNPNSFETVAKVLDTIQQASELTSPDRKWISVFCDGVPYTIGCRLVHEMMECKTCNAVGMNLKCKAESHVLSNKYSKIVMRPGSGHFELNIVRSIFSVFFDIFIEPIAVILGFSTPRALEYCKKALDHHKSWQILQIVFVALTDELLHLYMKVATASHSDVSVEAFENWCFQQTYPNFHMAADFVFNFLHPLFLFRAGVRQCNDEITQAALFKVSTVFFGFNHPKYRLITARDTFYLLSLPMCGAGPAKRNGFRMKRSCVGQGLDFQLEERNKLQKQWIFSHGTPTESQWKKASSTLTYFEQLKMNVLKELGIQEEGRIHRHITLGEAYLRARSHYRGIFSNKSIDLTSFSGSERKLPPKFLDCAITCEENKRKYMQAFLKQEKCVLNLVDTTDLLLLELEDLKKRVGAKIRQLLGYSKEAMLEKQKKCVTAEDFIELLGEVEEEIWCIDYSFQF